MKKKNYSTPTIHNVAVIPGHSQYLVYDNGQIFSIRSGRFLTQFVTGKNHFAVQLDGENVYVHRLVAEAFIPNPNGYDCVHHIDGNPENNDVSNLMWIARSDHQRMHMLGKTHNVKPVMRVSDGAIFPSASAASRAIGLNDAAVANSIAKRIRAGGSYWCYVEEEDADIWEDEPDYEGRNIFED